MNFTFIHAADIHLDSPLKGLEKYEGFPIEEIRTAPRKALVNLVDTAIKRDVDFVIIAGDVYDGDWRDFNTGLFFTQQMIRLKQHHIPVYLIKGNHDAASKMTKSLKLPDNVKEFSVRKPETFIIENLQVAIHGQGFANREVMENLALSYPNKVQGYFNIGVLHTSATGSGDGEHETYAPCTVKDMESKGYDYWALGHIHKRELLCENPVILFPGNIQGRHIKETGDKGCTVVKVENGEIIDMEHVSLDVLRFDLCEVDVTNTESYEEIYERVGEIVRKSYLNHDQKTLLVRIVLHGATDLHGELVSDKETLVNNLRIITAEIAGDIWVEKVKIRTQSKIDLVALKASQSPEGVILSYMDNLDEQVLDELLGELTDLYRQMPIELKDELMVQTSQQLKERLEEVESVILYELQKGGIR